jgi:hypothetical protein
MNGKLLTLARKRNNRYNPKVLAVRPANLIAYWPLNELAGAVAGNMEGTADRDGAYTGVTLGEFGIGDGGRAPYFDGANDYVNIYTASLDGAFNGAEGTLMAWLKVSAEAVWTDGSFREAIELRVDNNNRVVVQKKNTNVLAWTYVAGGVAREKTKAVTPLGWFCMGFTWSAAANQAIPYYDGVSEGAIAGAVGVWAGALAATTTVIGAYSTIPVSPWKGLIAHVALWTAPLAAAEMALLAGV